eukprot:877800_1
MISDTIHYLITMSFYVYQSGMFLLKICVKRRYKSIQTLHTNMLEKKVETMHRRSVPHPHPIYKNFVCNLCVWSSDILNYNDNIMSDMRIRCEIASDLTTTFFVIINVTACGNTMK